MAIKLGSGSISKVYIGSAEFTKAYLGSTLVLGPTPAAGYITDTTSLAQGLVSYYNFNTNAYDSIGQANGDVIGATNVTGGILGNCYDFDGTNDYIDINDDFTLTDFSFSGWVKRDDTNSGYIYNRSGDKSLIYFSTNTLNFYDSTGGTLAILTITDTDWHHVVVTYDSATTTLKGYVDNVLRNSSTSWTNAAWTASDTVNIGRYTGASSYFNGKIDEISIYNRSISSTEITNLYNSGDALPYHDEPFNGHATLGTDLVAYYPFDSDANDAYGTNDGTVSGATPAVGLVNKGYEFDSVNDYVDTGYAGFNTNLSVSMWIKRDTLLIDAAILGKWTGTAGTRLGLYFPPSTNFLQFYNGVGWENIYEIADTDTWHHVVLTRDGSNWEVYIDGTSRYTKVRSIPSNTVNWIIGAFTGVDNNFAGLIDEVGIWNKQLSSQEVSDLYNSGLGLPYTNGHFSGSSTLNTGVVANYSFLNDASDSLGLSDGTANGATHNTSGKIASCYEFDGSNDYMDFANTSYSKAYPDGFTVNFWLNTDTISPTGYKNLVSFANTTSITSAWINSTIGNDDTYNVGLFIGGSALYLTDTPANYGITAGTWQMHTYRYDGSTWKLYINGVEKDSGAKTGSFTWATGNIVLNFGREVNNNIRFYDGKMDEFLFYERALSQAEITELYNSGDGLQY